MTPPWGVGNGLAHTQNLHRSPIRSPWLQSGQPLPSRELGFPGAPTWGGGAGGVGTACMFTWLAESTPGPPPNLPNLGPCRKIGCRLRNPLPVGENFPHHAVHHAERADSHLTTTAPTATTSLLRATGSLAGRGEQVRLGLARKHRFRPPRRRPLTTLPLRCAALWRRGRRPSGGGGGGGGGGPHGRGLQRGAALPQRLVLQHDAVLVHAAGAKRPGLNLSGFFLGGGGTRCVPLWLGGGGGSLQSPWC